MDFADVMAAARPREEVVALCMAGDLNAEFERLEADLDKALAEGQATHRAIGDGPPGRDIALAIEDVQARMSEHTVSFTMRALGHKAWSDLLAAHAPEDPARNVFHPVTFPPALVTACSADPVMTAEQVAQLFEVLNQGQRDRLFGAAWRANHGVDIPFSQAASETLLSSAPN